MNGHGLIGRALLAVWLLLPLAASAAGPLRLIYPAPESANDNRDADVLALLKQALALTEASDGAIELVPSKPMSETMSRHMLRSGGGMDVIWSSVTREIHGEFIGVPIPVRRGILGYRVLIVRKADLPRFARINTLDELTQLRVGQGQGWNDIPLLQANQFKVVASPTYEGIFRLLQTGRVDYLSRGINEAWSEVAARPLLDLAVEPTLLLYYPWPKYFFVNRNRPELAKRIEKGLAQMLANGSYESLFKSFHQVDIERADLRKRRVFCLKNDELDMSQIPAKKAYWWVPYPEFPCLRDAR